MFFFSATKWAEVALSLPFWLLVPSWEHLSQLEPSSTVAMQWDAPGSSSLLKVIFTFFFCLAIFKLTCFLCPQMDGERDGAIHKQRDCEGQGMLKCMLPMKEMFFQCQPVPCWKRVSERPATATLICFIFLTLGDPKWLYCVEQKIGQKEVEEQEEKSLFEHQGNK